LAVEEKSREDTGPGTLAGTEKTGSRTLDLGTGGHYPARRSAKNRPPVKTKKPTHAQDLEAGTASEIGAEESFV
jgi:hypothetical protein